MARAKDVGEAEASARTDGRPPSRRRTGPSVAVVLIAAALAVVGVAVLVTYTGLPGPGPLRRYPLHDLQSLADRFNRADRGAASVDLLHARVRVNAIVLSCPNLLVGPDRKPAPQFSASDQAMIESSGPVITGLHSCPIR